MTKRVTKRSLKRERLNSSESDSEDFQNDFCLESIPFNFRVQRDYSKTRLKPDHKYRPIWCQDNNLIILESFAPLSSIAKDFLVVISEPISRPNLIHEYRITEYSLYAAVSVGLDCSDILKVLETLSKSDLPVSVIEFVGKHTRSFGKVKLVLKAGRFFVEADDPVVLQSLLQESVIGDARVECDGGDDDDVQSLAQNSLPFKDTNFSAKNVLKQLDDAMRVAISNPSISQMSSNSIIQNPKIIDQKNVDPQKNKNSNDSIFQIDDDDEQQQEFDPFFDEWPENQTSHKKNKVDFDDMNDDDFGIDDAALSLAMDQFELNVFNGNVEYHDSSIVTIGEEDENQEQSDTLFTQSFEIKNTEVEKVRKRCSEISLPMLEEYDFKNDILNQSIKLDLKPSTRLRAYQENSLGKMFGNGRARSGIIVLPCGAGKTLVGVTAAATIKKSVLVLCTSSVSVEQWAREFKTWTSINPDKISKFTSNNKEKFSDDTEIVISTYTMISYQAKRAYDAQKKIDFIKSREWGFLLLDEVHVVPAEMFRKVLTIVAAHCKLGLTATLVREDEKISNLNYLIGPKLFEANWMELAKDGHIARVQCVEVWCPMTPEFYREYLREKPRKRQLLYTMNPTKLQSCQYLINYHEARGDKIIVFSDNVFALKHYAQKLNKPYLFGGTSQAERLRILSQFQHNPALNTLFLSKVGDTSLDLPEASCLIQISSHYGSRRQEAQRLGRILRAKNKGQEGINAFFYTLVSKDTDEMYYSTKRQQFLVDQGYQYKVITELEGMEFMDGLVYPNLETQLELLNTALVTNESLDVDESDSGVESEVEQVEDFRVVRNSVNLNSMSGADSMAYLEVSANRRLKPMMRRR